MIVESTNVENMHKKPAFAKPMLAEVPYHYLNRNNEDINGEIWKDIDFTQGFYEVSNLGRIRSTNYLIEMNGGVFYNKGKILKQYLANNRELMICIGCSQLGLKRNMYLVNRLVAIAFIDNPYNLPLAIHINCNNLDNRADNLQWATHTENVNKEVAQKRRSNSLKIAKEGNYPSENFFNNQHIGLKKSQETRRRGVKIEKNNIVKEFNTTREAEIFLNCNRGQIHSAINRGLQKEYGMVYGYKCEFTN